MGATVVAAGALVGAYLLDPERGNARRAAIAARTARLAGRTRSRISQKMPFRVKSKATEQAESWPDEAPPDVDSES